MKRTTKAPAVRRAKSRPVPRETPTVARIPLPAQPTERSEAFETLARDLLTFAGHFDRFSAKRVSTGGVGKKTVQRVAPTLRRGDEEYATFLGLFLLERRVLFEGEDRLEVSRPNLARLWTPERLLRSLYHFWLRTALWNESLQDPDVLAFVRREFITQDPSLEARRRRLCEELSTSEPGERIELGALVARLDRNFQGRRGADDGSFGRFGGRVSAAAALRRMLSGPLSWMGLVEPAVERPTAPAAVEAFRVTTLGRKVLAENWGAVLRALGTALYDPRAQITLQPNLEILVPPDVDPATYLHVARLADLRSVDIYSTFLLTWDSAMNALDRGANGGDLMAFLESVSATGVPATVRQLIEDCEGRHGEVQLGVAGPYIEARESTLLAELEANPRFAPLIQRRVGDEIAFLASNVDLGRLGKELRKAGYNVSAAGVEKLSVTAHGAQLSVTHAELEELYAAVRAATKLAREVDPDCDLSALARLEETLALELSRQESTGAQARAAELESLIDKLLRVRAKRSKADGAPVTEAKDTEDIRSLLLAAVEAHTPMEIEYDGFQGVTRRIVEPASFDGRYLTGFCRLRQDQRVFNSARILSARLMPSPS